MAKNDDEVPPLSDLIARQEQEKREARDLLAGFDRPGRSPKQPASGDFVAHYSGKQVDKKESKKDRSREAATFVLPKKEERLRAILPWLAAAALMSILGFLVAFVATRDPEQTHTAPLPSSATTITSVIRAREDVPPPDPSPTTQTTEQTIAVPPPSVTSSPSSRAHGPKGDDSYLRDF